MTPSTRGFEELSLVCHRHIRRQLVYAVDGSKLPVVIDDVLILIVQLAGSGRPSLSVLLLELLQASHITHLPCTWVVRVLTQLGLDGSCLTLTSQRLGRSALGELHDTFNVVDNRRGVCISLDLLAEDVGERIEEALQQAARLGVSLSRLRSERA